MVQTHQCKSKTNHSSLNTPGDVASLLSFSKLHHSKVLFNPIRHWGAMIAPQNVFDHCAQTRKRRKLKLGDF